MIAWVHLARKQRAAEPKKTEKKPAGANLGGSRRPFH
jgi:hypothetical protein